MWRGPRAEQPRRLSLDLALPDAHHGPPGVTRSFGVPGVSFYICRDLGFPARGVRSSEMPRTVRGAAVPETTVDEDSDGIPGEHEVRGAARSNLAMQPKSEPKGVDGAPEVLLRFGVPYAAASELCTARSAHPFFVCTHESMLPLWAATPWACSAWQTDLDDPRTRRTRRRRDRPCVEIPLGILAEAGISPGTKLLVFSDGTGASC